MTINDRFTQGLLAGILGGIPSLAWGLFSQYILKFSSHLYGDFAAALIYGKNAANIWDKLFNQLVVFMFFGLGGIIFAFLVRRISSRNLVLKGMFWAGMIWFFSYAVTRLYKVAGLVTFPLPTAVSHLIGALIWGVAMALIYNYLNQKTLI